MNRRYCERHTHRGSSRAWRMILAAHCYDRDAQQHVIDEIGDCADCWRDAALGAVSAADILLITAEPTPEPDLPPRPQVFTAVKTSGLLHPSGLVEGPSVNWLIGVIDSCLYAEELDRQDLQRGQDAA